MAVDDFLIGPCAEKMPCYNADCPHVAAQGPYGTYFITMGHAGFNSPRNNGLGYANAKSARKMHEKICASHAAAVRVRNARR